MNYQEQVITEGEISRVLKIEENHFNDFKAKDISGNKFSKIVSAFANASGGDIYIGIREENNTKTNGTESNGQNLTYTGINTTHVFTKTKKTQKALVVDLREDKADVTQFFDTVTTCDTLQAKAKG